MLACSLRTLAAAAAVAGAAPPPLSLPSVQQRLFSGGLFPVDINRNLHRFALQHNLTSRVWVPLKAFDTVLAPLNVFVLPSASLCDISLPPGGPTVGQTSGVSSSNRVLVNAQHTSNPQLFEGFLDLLVPSPAAVRSLRVRGSAAGETSRRGGAGAGGSGCPSHNASRLFDCPVNRYGEAILDPEACRKLLRLKQEKGYASNYWIRAGGGAHCGPHGGHSNAEDTDWPGRLNPTYANGYRPVSLTGAVFRASLAQVMQVRVAKYGYVSPLWVTLAEAQDLLGTRLRPERADDAPWVLYGGDSVMPVVLYCADQFEDGERLFPSPREIALAGKGVWPPLERMRAFPLLRRLHKETTATTTRTSTKREAETGEGEATPPSASVSGDSRAGADVSMRDAKRHLRLIEEREKLTPIRLFGFHTREAERRILRENGLEAKLLERAILRGYPTPHFMSHRHATLYGLPPRVGEVGTVLHPVPCHLWDEAWTDGEVWFNVVQMEEPWTALALFYHHPVQFLTRRRLSRALATQCCQLQLRLQYKSNEWVPRCVSQDAGWRVRRDAPGIPFSPSSFNWDYARGEGGEGGLAPRMANTLVNLDEVELPDEAKRFLRDYRPVDAKGRPYLRTMRALTALRAHEQGYTSPVWVPVHPDSPYVCKLHPLPPGHALASARSSSSARGPQTHLTGAAFAQRPLIRFRGALFANAEEVEDWDPSQEEPPVPLADMCAFDRAREERGEGTSAEKLNVPQLRRERFNKEDREEVDFSSFSPGDTFDAAHDIPADGF